jgi:hypothetical protein
MLGHCPARYLVSPHLVAFALLACGWLLLGVRWWRGGPAFRPT